MKVFIACVEGADAAHHSRVRITVPKSWRPGPVRKLAAFAVETHNKKRPENALDAENAHLEVEGRALGSEDVIEAQIRAHDVVFARDGREAA